MVFSSFRVWLAVGEFVREGQVPFLYCSFWFMKSGKRVLGSKGEHKGSKGEHMPRGQGTQGHLLQLIAERGCQKGKREDNLFQKSLVKEKKETSLCRMILPDNGTCHCLRIPWP